MTPAATSAASTSRSRSSTRPPTPPWRCPTPTRRASRPPTPRTPPPPISARSPTSVTSTRPRPRSRCRSTTRTGSCNSAPDRATAASPTPRARSPRAAARRSGTPTAAARSPGSCPPTPPRRRRWSPTCSTLGVRRLDVVSDAEYPPLDSGIAHLVAADAPAAGVTLVGRQTKVATQSVSAPASYASLAQTIAAAHPDGVLLGASPNGGADALFRELHAKAPKLKLFAASTLATPSFLGALGAAAAATYVTSPILEPSQYPAPRAPCSRSYRRRYPGEGAPSAYALYGYEAMEDVLAAIAPRRPLRRQPPARRQRLLSPRSPQRRARRPTPSTPTATPRLDRFDGYRVGAGGRLVAAEPIS